MAEHMIKKHVQKIVPHRLRSTEKMLTALFVFLRLSIVVSIIWAFMVGNWEAFFINIIAIVLTFIPHAIERQYKVTLPIEFHLVIVLFIYLSMFLGETLDAYERFFWWDAMLHTVSGVVLSFAGFMILYILYVQKKLIASPFIFAFFTFSVGLAFGGVWEIFEFGVDSLFGTNMQKNGLSDTMWDLIVDAIGALAMSFAAYNVIRTGDRKGLVQRSLDRFFDDNPKLKKRHWWERSSNG